MMTRGVELTTGLPGNSALIWQDFSERTLRPEESQLAK